MEDPDSLVPPSPEKRRRLASVPLFASLEGRALDDLLAETITRRLAPREALFHKGDHGEHLYVVMSGRLRAKARVADGREVIVALMGPQEVIGEISLLDSEPRSAINFRPAVRRGFPEGGAALSDTRRQGRRRSRGGRSS